MFFEVNKAQRVAHRAWRFDEEEGDTKPAFRALELVWGLPQNAEFHVYL